MLCIEIHYEIVVIFEAHTIVDPRTVMVEAFDTGAAHIAMARSSSSYSRAIWTQLRAVNHIKQVHEIDLVILEIPGLLTGCKEEKDYAAKRCY